MFIQYIINEIFALFYGKISQMLLPVLQIQHMCLLIPRIPWLPKNSIKISKTPTKIMMYKYECISLEEYSAKCQWKILF